MSSTVGLDFTDPKQMGLLGMAAGLLQASGASRLPVTMGQGLGMGLEGYVQGSQNAMRSSLMQSQAQEAQLQAKEAALRYPFLKSFYQGFGPNQNAGQMGPTPPIAAMTGTPASAVAGVSPTGIPQPSGATVYPLPAQASVSDPTQPVAPANAAPGGIDPQSLIKEGIMYNMALGAGSGSPMVSKGLDLMTAQQLARSKLAGQDPVAYDLAMAKRYQGSPLANLYMNDALQKAGALQISSWSGNRNEYNPVTGQWDFYGPTEGIQSHGNAITPIPGFQQTMEGNQAARAIGEAAGQVVKVQLPDGSFKYVPRAAFVGPPGAQSAPGNSQNAPGGNAGQSPLFNEYQRNRGEKLGEYQTGLDTAADSATATNYAFGQMQQAAQNFTPGPGENLFMKAIATPLAAVSKAFGVKAPTDLTSWQEFTKYANQVAFAASRQLGTREAYQVVELQIKSNPNADLTQQSVAGLIGSMKAMNKYIVDKQQAMQNWVQAHGSPQGFDASWNHNYDPRAWDIDNLDPQQQLALYRSLPKSELQKLRNSYSYVKANEEMQ